MSLLSSFITTNLIKCIESEFTNNSDEIQSVIIKEVEALIAEATHWLNSKMDSSDNKE